MFLLLRRKSGMPITAIIGIGLSYEPRPSARRLPARRVPQNSARSAEFCTSASPSPHRLLGLFDHFEPVYIGSESRTRADLGVIRLSSRSSFEWAVIQKIEFLSSKKCLVPPMVFDHFEPCISAQVTSQSIFWCHSTQLAELNRMTYNLSQSESV